MSSPLMPWDRWRSTRLGSMLTAGATSAEIAATLDSLESRQRVREALALSGSGVGALYDAMAAAPVLDLEEVVPSDAPIAATFIYEGRNSLPTFSRFQKRFARISNGGIVGHNHQPWSAVTGPGYFVVRPASRDEIVPNEPFFDYTVAPDAEPTGWPRYRSNEWGPSLLVFAHMKDYLRRVARGVLVGKAYKKGSPIGQYFLLARAD